MKNEAARSADSHKTRDNFNSFTTRLLEKVKAGKKVFVELRNGFIVQPEWFVDPHDDSYQYLSYQRSGLYLIWYNNGQSIKGEDFDMVKTIKS